MGERIEAARLAPCGAVFLDRDGVLNEDSGYVGEIERFVWLPGAREAILSINRAGFYTFVVTNQSGVARGLYNEEAVRRIHDHMQAELGRTGAWIDDFRYCPHHEDGSVGAYRIRCGCRKPKPGMVLDLITAWAVDPARSIMIGDSPRDAAAGVAAGISGYLLKPEEGIGDVVTRFLDKLNF